MNRLNCMNYRIDDFIEHDMYFITDGYRGLWRLSKVYRVNFKNMARSLISCGQFQNIDNRIVVTMI
jgi:hypothetical protein